MAEIKYVKFADTAVIEATQVSESITDMNGTKTDQLLIQIDTDSTENQIADLQTKITDAGLKDVNIFADKECTNKIFVGGAYKSVNSITATVRACGLLYSISLSK
jgi:ribosomal protein L23